MGFRHPAFKAILFIALTALFFLFFYEGHSSSNRDRERFMGKWTEEEGEPENYIHFWLVRKTLPGSPLDAYEGHAEFHRQLGVENEPIIWNFGHFDPLQINLTVQGKSQYANIRMLDDEHLLIHFTSNPALDAAWQGPVKRMTRVPGEGLRREKE